MRAVGGRIRVGQMVASDWNGVAGIYRQGIEDGEATFEVDVPSWEEWDAGHLPDPRLVARSGRLVAGWAALAPVSDRCAYRGVAWDSVYVRREARGRGIGRALLERLVRDSETAGIWTLQAGVFPENEASIALHERCGFRVVGVRERLGSIDGRWRDVVLLERRSSTAPEGGR
jgi:L-amino acid N-acyltransferase YncA